jgi:hypothetical protein
MDAEMIGNLVRAIVDEEMALTHAVLVAHRGKLVVEEYFYGFERETWHDMRSASKTLASTLVSRVSRLRLSHSSRGTSSTPTGMPGKRRSPSGTS